MSLRIKSFFKLYDSSDISQGGYNKQVGRDIKGKYSKKKNKEKKA